MNATEEPLSLEAATALQFLDRHQGDWYCITCWAETLLVEERILERLAVRLASQEAEAAGYGAGVAGPCKTCDAGGRPRAGRKSAFTVRTLGSAATAHDVASGV